MIESADRRLVIVVRADPVICGHSGEARNLAEVALQRGFDDVRIVTWPLQTLQASKLPLKPLDHVMPYSDGITVERPEGVGDYRVPDGRVLAGITGRLVELFTDEVPTVAMSLYLTPHTNAVIDAKRAAQGSGLPVDVTTIAEAVGSDITNVVRSCVEADRYGAAAHLLSTYLANDVCVAVSEYTRDLIITAATEIDARHGTRFAALCAERVQISYPAIDSSAYIALDPATTRSVLARRGLRHGEYAMFLSRLTKAKGVNDLVAGYARSRARHDVQLLVAGNGPEAVSLRAQAATSGAGDRIVFLDDVSDEEKPHLMAGSAAYLLPSKPRPEFVETFGIALVEKMLAGGGPVITCPTGGIPEAVGDTAVMVPTGSPQAIAEALDFVIGGMTPAERSKREAAARAFAMRFDRERVFDDLFGRVAASLAA
ncbi:MAG TPA: glycosyltransferase [Ilumatobacter sp.]|nr:glycosyltransferase [Ilumatobacter sp.]